MNVHWRVERQRQENTVDRRRYNHSDRPTPQELAAHRRAAKVQAEAARHGHDDAAAQRARSIQNARELRDQMAQTFATHLGTLEEIFEKEVAKIRAQGPVGCTCTWPECVTSRANL